MDRWQGKTCVVTGAGSGNGAAIAKEFVKAGLTVIGLDLNEENIQKIRSSLSTDYQAKFHAKKCNVCNEEEVKNTFDWIKKSFNGIDILVNNAGIVRPGMLSTMEPKVAKEILDTNVMGYVNCTREAFKSMTERNFDGHIILINSAFGHNIPPVDARVSINMYAPSKFAVTAMTEIYRQEFFKSGTKVKITSICPGMVSTAMISDEIKKENSDKILFPEDIANAVLFAVGTPPHVQIHEISLKPFGEPV